MKRKRMQKLARAALVCLIILVMLILLGIVMAPKPLGQKITYTVRPGETLWDIARELDVENWQKWHYEVCEQNNIPYGGLISPGEELILFAEIKN